VTLPKADEYRRHAAECLKMLSHISDVQRRAMFTQMAVTWVNLADQAEGNVGVSLVYETEQPRIAQRVHAVVRERAGRDIGSPKGDMVAEELRGAEEA
jgi:hypothetical protein